MGIRKLMLGLHQHFYVIEWSVNGDWTLTDFLQTPNNHLSIPFMGLKNNELYPNSSTNMLANHSHIAYAFLNIQDESW